MQAADVLAIIGTLGIAGLLLVDMIWQWAKRRKFNETVRQEESQL